MFTKLARDLVEGDVIDLTPALEAFPWGMTPEEQDNDISNFEYAMVDSIDDFAAFVVLYTDQHNMTLPSYFEFEVYNEEFDSAVEESFRRAEVAPSMDGGR